VDSLSETDSETMTVSRSSAPDQSPPGEPWSVELRSESPDQTRLLGEQLGGLLRAGDLVLLHGSPGGD
jgi:hypothetical protein